MKVPRTDLQIRLSAIISFVFTKSTILECPTKGVKKKVGIEKAKYKKVEGPCVFCIT